MTCRKPKSQPGTDMVLASEADKTVDEHRLREFSSDIIQEAEARMAEKHTLLIERRAFRWEDVKDSEKKVEEKTEAYQKRLESLDYTDGCEGLVGIDKDRAKMARSILYNSDQICEGIRSRFSVVDDGDLSYEDFVYNVCAEYIEVTQGIHCLVTKYLKKWGNNPEKEFHKVLMMLTEKRDDFYEDEEYEDWRWRIDCTDKEDIMRGIGRIIFDLVNLPEKDALRQAIRHFDWCEEQLKKVEKQLDGKDELELDLGRLEALTENLEILFKLQMVKGEVNMDVLRVLYPDCADDEIPALYDKHVLGNRLLLLLGGVHDYDKSFHTKWGYKRFLKKKFEEGAPSEVEALYSMIEWCTMLHKRGQIILDSGCKEREKEGRILVEIARIYIERLYTVAVDIEQQLQVGDMDMANLQEHMATLSAFRRGERSVMSLIEEHEMQLAAALEAEDLTGKGAEERELDEFQLKLVGTDG